MRVSNHSHQLTLNVLPLLRRHTRTFIHTWGCTNGWVWYLVLVGQYRWGCSPNTSLIIIARLFMGGKPQEWDRGP